MKVKLIIEYKGTSFCGWQKQVDQVSIQSTIESAAHMFLTGQLKKNGFYASLPLPHVYVQGSGRTDAGVHALGQVATFDWPNELTFDAHICTISLNGLFNNQISVLSATLVPDTFHPRISAKHKTYLYKILHRNSPPTIDQEFVWHVRKLDNLDGMLDACSVFNGVHDFDFFRASDCNAKTSVREVIKNSFTIDGNSIEYSITGTGFLKHQVRFIVGSLVAIGKNRMTAQDLVAMLNRTDKKSIELAPAHGLYLKEVAYD